MPKAKQDRLRWVLRVIRELDRAIEMGMKQRAALPVADEATDDRDLRISLDALRAAAEALRHIAEEVDQEGRRYADLVDFVPAAYVETDADLIIRRTNAAAASVLRWSERVLLGKPLIAFVVERQFTEFLHRISTLRRDSGARIERWPVLLRPQEGEPVRALVDAAAIQDPHNGLNGFRFLLREEERENTG